MDGLNNEMESKKMENTQVTGRLENWSYSKKENVIVGNLYDDVNGRWTDGQFVRTSSLKDIHKTVAKPIEGTVVATMNSKYLLGKRK